MAVDRFSITSACGRSYRVSRLRTYQGNVSLSWRWDSTAIVEKTIEDFPEPDTPVNTVSFPLGMVSETFLRLFSRTPPRTMSPPNRAFVPPVMVRNLRSPHRHRFPSHYT